MTHPKPVAYQGLQKHTWVCFDCRRSVRRPPSEEPSVRCPDCGRHCESLGTKTPIPPRHKVSDWEDLLKYWRERQRDARQEQARARVRERQRLEARLAELESGPTYKGRNRDLRDLRERLDALQ